MKKSVLLAIWGVLLILTNALADGFAMERWLEVSTRCAKSLSEGDRALILSTEPDNGRLKDYSFCLYTGIGYFHDGAFDPVYIRTFVEDLYPDKSISEPIYQWNVKHIKEANALQGDDRDKTYLFWDRGNDEEFQKLTDHLSNISPIFEQISLDLVELN
ncbi:uncharacterized protein LOC107037856 [Diachasma alloeum]|uniref:uncharacterized protein LOC107037856 n=1 Tax=Diachasma alloeum TaxID=454923 RepID=UPI0007384C8E|nr:uncharacterized protein LOC107037856 [Diachasma alloeum]